MRVLWLHTQHPDDANALVTEDEKDANAARMHLDAISALFFFFLYPSFFCAKKAALPRNVNCISAPPGDPVVSSLW